MNEKQKEYNKKYNKKYYEKNKEKRKAYNKKYKEEHKEEQKEYRKKYKENGNDWYEKNKEVISVEGKKAIITCECGRTLRRDGLERHLKTTIHDKLISQKPI